MANLKDLKTRIASVKSTQKITKAMQMVAASKLRRAKERAEQAGPYTQRMERMLQSLASNMSENDTVPKLLSGTGKDKTYLLTVITSDRGLCGGLNSHIIKEVKQTISALSSQGKDIKIFCIGRKGHEALKREYESNIIEYVEGLTKKNLTYQDAEEQAQKILGLFDDGQFDVCLLFYNTFVSAIEQTPTKQQMIPLDKQDLEEGAEKDDAVYDYEPDENAILKEILPKNISIQILHALLANSASEHGARMSAMDNATRNAGDMIKKLTLVYNRTRQATITKELIEIISGAEAL